MFPHTVPALSDDEVLPVPDYRIWQAQSGIFLEMTITPH
jgi:hypothetical protein